MKVVIQRVSSASVSVDGKVVSEIKRGLLVLLGIKKGDTADDRDYLIRKILKLRIFPNEDSPFDKSVVDVGGQILLVSQFTLYGDCSKGNRPSFYEAMPPAEAQQAYNEFAAALRKQHPEVQEGVFRAPMEVLLTNDGPTTILITSRQ